MSKKLIAVSMAAGVLAASVNANAEMNLIRSWNSLGTNFNGASEKPKSRGSILLEVPAGALAGGIVLGVPTFIATKGGRGMGGGILTFGTAACGVVGGAVGGGMHGRLRDTKLGVWGSLGVSVLSAAAVAAAITGWRFGFRDTHAMARLVPTTALGALIGAGLVEWLRRAKGK